VRVLLKNKTSSVNIINNFLALLAAAFNIYVMYVEEYFTRSRYTSFLLLLRRVNKRGVSLTLVVEPYLWYCD